MLDDHAYVVATSCSQVVEQVVKVHPARAGGPSDYTEPHSCAHPFDVVVLGMEHDGERAQLVHERLKWLRPTNRVGRVQANPDVRVRYPLRQLRVLKSTESLVVLEGKGDVVLIECANYSADGHLGGGDVICRQHGPRQDSAEGSAPTCAAMSM